MTRVRRLVALSTVAAAALLGGCASHADGIDAATKTLLQRDVQTLTSAAARGDYSAARAATATIDADLAAAHTSGRITDSRLSQIRASVLKVKATLAAEPRPAPAPTTPRSKPKPSSDENQGGDGGD